MGIEEKGAKKFTEVTFENKIVKVAMGGIVSLFLDEKGNAYECGSLFGRKNLWQEAPIQWLPIKIAEGIADITCGEGTIFLLNRQGEIFSRGSNERGISGTGSTEEFIPLLTKINMEEKVKFIQAANMVHCYAVTENGSFYVWGDNLEHVFDPTADFFPVPKQIELGFSPISIKPGVMHLFLFDEENNIYGFGRNRVRQLFVGQDPLEKPVLITWEAIQSK